MVEPRQAAFSRRSSAAVVVPAVAAWLKKGPAGIGHILLMLLMLWTCSSAANATGSEPVEVAGIRSLDPPAYGYQVGDIVQRTLALQLPPGGRFDPSSLPKPTRQGAVELQRVEHEGADDASEQAVRLHYQIMRSPEAPSVFELPSLRLRVTVPAGSSRREALLHVQSHPLLVSPIAPLQPPERSGLGLLQPDLPPVLPSDEPLRWQLRAGLAAASLGGLGLAWRFLIRSLLRRRQSPFARAARDVRRLLAQPGGSGLDAALRRIHAAITEDAGQVVHRADLAAWLLRRPGLRALQPDLQAFYADSERHFFAPAEDGAATTAAATDPLAQALSARVAFVWDSGSGE
jgi:mxaA protein